MTTMFCKSHTIRLCALVASGVVMATTPAAAGFVAQTETGTFAEFTFSRTFSSLDSGSNSFDFLTAQTPVTGIGRFRGDANLLEKITFEWSGTWSGTSEVDADVPVTFEPFGQFSLGSSSGSRTILFAFDNGFDDFLSCDGSNCPDSNVFSNVAAAGSAAIPNTSFDLNDLPLSNFVGATGDVIGLEVAIGFFVDQFFDGDVAVGGDEFFEDAPIGTGLIDITLRPGEVTVNYHVVPLPAAAWMMISGLAAMGGLAYRLRQRAAPAI